MPVCGRDERVSDGAPGGGTRAAGRTRQRTLQQPAQDQQHRAPRADLRVGGQAPPGGRRGRKGGGGVSGAAAPTPEARQRRNGDSHEEGRDGHQEEALEGGRRGERRAVSEATLGKRRTGRGRRVGRQYVPSHIPRQTTGQLKAAGPVFFSALWQGSAATDLPPHGVPGVVPRKACFSIVLTGAPSHAVYRERSHGHDLVRRGRSLGHDHVRHGHRLRNDLVRRGRSLGHDLVRRGRKAFTEPTLSGYRSPP